MLLKHSFFCEKVNQSLTYSFARSVINIYTHCKLWQTQTHIAELGLSGVPCCWVCFFWAFLRGEGAEWLPFRHVIAVWKDCFTLFISSLAKLGVFYTLTHFGMEKHEKKKLTRLPVTWHLSREADGEWRRKERGKEMPHLLCEECNRKITAFRNLFEF